MKKISPVLLRAAGIVFGSFLFACGISLFLDPNDLAPGGFTGIAVILNRLTGLETGTWLFVLNIPVLLLGLWRFGGRFMLSTVCAVGLVSWITNRLSALDAVTQDPLLAALAGSILMGLGIGTVFRCGSTTGGADIVVKFLHLKYPHIKTGTLFLMLDLIIVAASGLVFQNFNIVMYAFLAVIVSGKVMDYVLYGQDEAALVYIISSKSSQIADRILTELHVGLTFLSGTGGYSNEEKQVIFSVVKRHLAPKIENIVKQEDRCAFLILASANEIYGEGYKSLFRERL